MNITFIGGGNMASALIGGLLQQDFSPAQLCVVEISPEGREKIQHAFHVQTVTDLDQGAAHGEVIVLAVKPQQLSALARELAPLLENQLVISIAAGIRATDISRWLGGHDRVVRAMPNIPALIRAAVTGLYAMAGVMLVTAAAGSCPVYSLFGLRTCPVQDAATPAAERRV